MRLPDATLLHDPIVVKAGHQRRKSKRDVLRAILQDGEVHDSRELVERTGSWRYGARLQEIRDGWAGHPPMVVHRYLLAPGRWAFRFDPSGERDPKCDACPRCHRAERKSEVAA